MDKFNYFLLFCLLIPLFLFSQRIIDSDMNFDIIFEDQNVIITPNDEGLFITGSIILTTITHSVRIIPTVVYSVTIAPDTVYSRIGIDDDDDEERLASRITIYPNPTKNKITITSQKEIIALKLYNNYGILQIDPIITDNVVDLANYSSGIYMLRVYLINGEVLTETIVKQ